MPSHPDIARLTQELRQLLPALRRDYQVSSLEIFGSQVRGEARPDSDVDLLVELAEPLSLLRFLELEAYLSDALGRKVDLTLRDSLRRRIGRAILAEAVPV